MKQTQPKHGRAIETDARESVVVGRKWSISKTHHAIVREGRLVRRFRMRDADPTYEEESEHEGNGDAAEDATLPNASLRTSPAVSVASHRGSCEVVVVLVMFSFTCFLHFLARRRRFQAIVLTRRTKKTFKISVG